MNREKLKIVGVMGSGADDHVGLAQCVGRAVAGLGFHLLTGGGGGVMAAASRAFCEVSPRKGICIGILKGETYPTPGKCGTSLAHIPAAANEWVELVIHTHLPLSGSRGRESGSRNHINVLTSDILVALPGGGGTYSEVTLRIDYGGRVILFLGPGQIGGHAAEHFTGLSRFKEQVLAARSSGELEHFLRRARGSGQPA